MDFELDDDQLALQRRGARPARRPVVARAGARRDRRRRRLRPRALEGDGRPGLDGRRARRGARRARPGHGRGRGPARAGRAPRRAGPVPAQPPGARRARRAPPTTVCATPSRGSSGSSSGDAVGCVRMGRRPGRAPRRSPMSRSSCDDDGVIAVDLAATVGRAASRPWTSPAPLGWLRGRRARRSRSAAATRPTRSSTAARPT